MLRMDTQVAISPDLPDMTFSSSPVLYPQTSSPAPLPPKQKRKLFQSFNTREPLFKKQRTEESNLSIDAISEEDSATNIRDEELLLRQPYHEQVESLDNINISQPELDVNYSSRKSNPSLPCSATTASLRPEVRAWELQTCTGETLNVGLRKSQDAKTYEQTIAQRSVTAEGKAKKAYYGIDIHKLIDEAKIQQELDKAARERAAEAEPFKSIETPIAVEMNCKKSQAYQMWTEKYRAKKFTDLVGDERTHRAVLKWLKGWDPIVFPGNVTSKPKRMIYEDKNGDEQERQQRKILLLTGPPGLGKTTLAHVCAKQAGYEVLEINASDDRSREVVKGRIKDCLGTENVRGIKEQGKARKAGRPVCVIVDEVDGVVTGSGNSGGEGGFMKALIDLVQLDQKNSGASEASGGAKKGKGDKFRLMRPLILICNDVYAPSLRPLRSSSMAEIVHVRKAPLDKVIARLKTVFEKEKIPCDNDAVRRLCESSWGLGTRKQNSVGARGAGEGDIRGVLVQGEWMAHKLRASGCEDGRLTRKWVESHISNSQGSGAQKGLGRGGVREVVERIFIDGAGLPNLPTTLSADEARLVAESKRNPIGVADLRKRTAINALREMIDTCGDHDRLMTDCFATYPTQVFQDDTFLSKPDASYDWLHFHDSLSSRVFSGQEWELNPYLSTSACAFHGLFSAVDKGSSSWNDEKKDAEDAINVHPFSGSKADFAAYEAEKATHTVLTELQASFQAPLLRLFSSVDAIAMELVPNVSKMMAPDVKPVVVGGSGGGASVASVRKESEKNCVKSTVRVMHALNIEFERIRIENEGNTNGPGASGGFALRMEPPLDQLALYHFDKSASGDSSVPVATAPVRYAVRQVLDQELRKEKLIQASLVRQARVTKAVHDDKGNTKPNCTDHDPEADKENAVPTSAKQKMAAPVKVKRDFFGRPIVNQATPVPADQRPGSRHGDGTNSTAQAPQAPRGITRKPTLQHGAGDETMEEAGRVWVSFHEGFSNAVRKPITLADLMGSF